MTLLLLLNLVLFGDGPPQKWALAVGVNHYRNLPDLQGAVNDAAIMKDLLVGKMGFPEANVKTLLNEQATRAAILGELNDLTERLGENDTVVFHFSGHGSQMRDVSGDEPDGKDESLVPYDSREPGIFDISDDEIHEILKRLTERCQNVTFIFDSCHSGSGNRTFSPRRVAADMRDRPKPRGGAASSGMGQLSAGNYVMISACRSTETAGEIRLGNTTHGVLTHYLAKTLSRLEPGANWAFVMEQVRQEVALVQKNQTPQLHGNGERVVFGLETLDQEPHILASPTERGGIKLEGGLIHGLTVGSIFNIRRPKAGSKGDMVGQARVVAVHGLTSEAEWIRGGPAKRGDHAVEWEHRYPRMPLKIHFKAGARSLAQSLLDAKLVQEVEIGEAHLVMALNRSSNSLELRDPSGYLMGVPIPIGNPDLLKREMGKWTRWYNVLYIESMGARAPNATFSITSKMTGPSAKEGVFLAGDDLVMTVSNQSRRRLYITLIQLNTSGEITTIFPEPGDVAQPISPGDSWSETFVAELPEGVASEKSILKLFACLEPIDLSFLHQEGARGPSGRPVSWTVLQKTTVIKRK